MSKIKQRIDSLFAEADIQINGNNPWDIQVKDERFYTRLLQQESLGFGESYMDGWWNCDQLDACIERILRIDLRRYLKKHWQFFLYLLQYNLKYRLFNQQSKYKAFEVGEVHYDIGNDLFELMLDPTMSYSCGYWKEATDLAGAQQAKLKLICDKLGLAPGMKLLDIGCGWGGLAAFAAQHYGVEVVGITISRQQYELAKKRCEGLPVSIQWHDYRDLHSQFDRIVSVGMFEHVGYKNYQTFMQVAARNLKEGGLFLLHTIGLNLSSHTNEPWLNKYIFPNGMLPGIKQIGAAIEGVFVMEDWHNFGADYTKTLRAWYQNFTESWPQLRHKYNERFYRMWEYYLLSCAGSFAIRHTQLWQIVLSKGGVRNGYQSVR